MDPLQTAKEKFLADTFPQSLGIQLLDLAPGVAKVAMTLTEAMLNFHGIGHGGAIFTLADTALGLASNSHGQKAVALSVTINYISPALPGSKLIATAREQYTTRRTGVYDITIMDESERVIALARGITFQRED
ncbi:MAG: hydroxyphenylacetyl-CoA thioesterase PaaI [Moorellaceae bacterium]